MEIKIETSGMDGSFEKTAIQAAQALSDTVKFET